MFGGRGTEAGAGAAHWPGSDQRSPFRLRGGARSHPEPGDQAPVSRPTTASWDWQLVTAMATLLVLGIVMVYSASFVLAHNSPEYRSDTYFLVRQVVWAGIGIVAMLVCARLDYHIWQRVSVILMFGTIVLLIAVMVPGVGHSEYGAQRWLKFGPLPPVQPSELAKIAVIVYFADWLARKGDQVRDLSYGAIPFAILLGMLAGLVLIQPDLGTTTVIVGTAVAIYFVAGAHLLHFFAGIGLGTVALVFIVLGAGYRAQRLLAFLDPEKDPLGIGWHTLQTQIALGSGGLLGRGLGASRQKFFYLPAAHTDAIYAVTGEELGFVGCVAVILLFGFLAYRGFRIALTAADSFGTLLAVGVTCSLVFQALINMGVVVSVLPFTGITLPFVSSGGSSLLVCLASVGILLSVSRQTRG